MAAFVCLFVSFTILYRLLSILHHCIICTFYYLVIACYTKALNQWVRKARSDKLGKNIAESLGSEMYERWSFKACDRTSSVFLHSPPEIYGYMEDPVFQVSGSPCNISWTALTYYGFIGWTIFQEKGTKLDEYGTNLAAAPLPGQGHCVLHNHLQSLIMAMKKLGGISSEEETANFLLDEVGEPYITA